MAKRRSITVSAGAGKVRVLGVRRAPIADLYHLLINRSWSVLVALVVGAYLVVNTTFALLYLATGDCLANANQGSFEDAFFFSVQTLSTIGYGYIYPKCLSANLLVTAESLLGLMGVAVATGIAFNKFARPKARVLFSRNSLITRHDGQPTFMFRVGNERVNYIADATLQVTIGRPGKTSEGRPFTKLHDLTLVRQRSTAFILTWTALHTIDHTSPLHRETPDSLAAGRLFVIVTLTGYDASVGQTIHARHVYQPGDIVWGHRFVDVLTPAIAEDSLPQVDYEHFHSTLPETPASY